MRNSLRVSGDLDRKSGGPALSRRADQTRYDPTAGLRLGGPLPGQCRPAAVDPVQRRSISRRYPPPVPGDKSPCNTEQARSCFSMSAAFSHAACAGVAGGDSTRVPWAAPNRRTTDMGKHDRATNSSFAAKLALRGTSRSRTDEGPPQRAAAPAAASNPFPSPGGEGDEG